MTQMKVKLFLTVDQAVDLKAAIDKLIVKDWLEGPKLPWQTEPVALVESEVEYGELTAIEEDEEDGD